MAENWTRVEVEATVADYFEMLESQVRGVPYNKTAHRRALSKLLASRSDGAIERKHQNISAILIELGFIYIEGYKPLHNYQQLLFEITYDRLQSAYELKELVAVEVMQPATVPTVDDILRLMVPAPELAESKGSSYGERHSREVSRPTRIVDYLELESRNQKLGAAGEEFVVQYEIARLTAAGADGLASQIEHVSRTRGDGAGFDVLSFESNGKERFIEVKTTAYGQLVPFFVSRNELSVSKELADRYFLYRPFKFRDNPQLFAKAGALNEAFHLDPVQYLASA